LREDESLYAFEDARSVRNLFDAEKLPEDRRALAAELLRFRQSILNPSELRTSLAQLQTRSEAEQWLVLLFLKQAVFCTVDYDDAVSEWLSDVDGLLELLQKLPGKCLEPLLEALLEFQLRGRSELPSRLPHVFAFAIENAAERERVPLLFRCTICASVNVGIVSPIQRLLSSKWRAELMSAAETWHERLHELVPYSEPWVRARIRATAAAISRSIGPRRRIDEQDAAEPAPG
jgi:hypothetical protein